MVSKKKKRSKDRVSDLDLVTFLNSRRSKHAQEVDRGTLAQLTKIPEVWNSDPSRFDFMGVDTPFQSKPKRFNKNNAKRRSKREGFI